MALAFTKMHGLGNDFVVIDAVARNVALTPGQVQRLADRRFGVGCDQVLVIEPAAAGSDADFAYRIFNPDGSEAEQCGNGVRCIARFLRDAGRVDGDRVALDSAGGRVEPELTADGRVRVALAVPRLSPAEIPFEAVERAPEYAIDFDGETWHVGAVSVGNTHAVVSVTDTRTAPVATLGPRLGRHPRFPSGANVGFMQVLAPDRVRLRVFERGAGETLACGSGACAAVVAGRLQGRLDAAVAVELPGGELTVEWPGEGDPVVMTGPAETVFEGTVDPARLTRPAAHDGFEISPPSPQNSGSGDKRR